MKISLNYLNTEKIIKEAIKLRDKTCVILYADFNVINYFYENNVKIPPEFILYPDSTAVYIVVKFFFDKEFKKIISTDLQYEMLANFVMKKQKMFFLGDTKDILNKLKVILFKYFPEIKFSGFQDGYCFDSDNIIRKINESNTDILFVGLGATRQESWIINNYQKLDVKMIISVGGWFQYLSGNKKRAPLVIRNFHLEWFYKIMNEFNTVWMRYLFGVPKFFSRILMRKIKLELRHG